MAFADTNGPLPALTEAFPDVCLLPVPVIGSVPTPYPNIALKSTAIPDQVSFLVMCFPAHNLLTTTPLSQGDDAGVLCGVMSGLVMGPERPLTASFALLVSGLPATMLGSSTMQNSTNAFGFQIAPTQTVLATV
jgi:hypothetical protein